MRLGQRLGFRTDPLPTVSDAAPTVATFCQSRPGDEDGCNKSLEPSSWTPMSHPPLSELLRPVRRSCNLLEWSRRDAGDRLCAAVPQSARVRRALSPLKCSHRNSAPYVPMCVFPKTSHGGENGRPCSLAPCPLPVKVVRDLALQKADQLREERYRREGRLVPSYSSSTPRHAVELARSELAAADLAASRRAAGPRPPPPLHHSRSVIPLSSLGKLDATMRPRSAESPSKDRPDALSTPHTAMPNVASAPQSVKSRSTSSEF